MSIVMSLKVATTASNRNVSRRCSMPWQPSPRALGSLLTLYFYAITFTTSGRWALLMVLQPQSHAILAPSVVLPPQSLSIRPLGCALATIPCDLGSFVATESPNRLENPNKLIGLSKTHTIAMHRILLFKR